MKLRLFDLILLSTVRHISLETESVFALTQKSPLLKLRGSFHSFNHKDRNKVLFIAAFIDSKRFYVY